MRLSTTGLTGSNLYWKAQPIAEIYGGTNQTSYTTGDILYASATNTLSKLSIGSTGQVLKVSSGGIIEWDDDNCAFVVNAIPNTVAGETVPDYNNCLMCYDMDEFYDGEIAEGFIGNKFDYVGKEG